MRETVIHNWDELQRDLFEGVWDPTIMRYRANFVYRGTSDKQWGLVPSLNRVCSHNLRLEQSILRSFRKYAFADLAGLNSFWQILSVAQHYGLPTRLLDWTYSPLVAAHFATEDIGEYDKDGVIWCVNTEDFAHRLPEPFQVLRRETLTNILTVDMLDKVAGGLPEMAQISEKPFALFFEPASTLDRIANQYALFSMVSDPAVMISEIPDVPGGGARRIIIPADVKLEIRDKLDYINISERMIYPGLDGVCKWITRHYADLGPAHNHPQGP